MFLPLCHSREVILLPLALESTNKQHLKFAFCRREEALLAPNWRLQVSVEPLLTLLPDTWERPGDKRLKSHHHSKHSFRPQHLRCLVASFSSSELILRERDVFCFCFFSPVSSPSISFLLM